jgi:glutaredoxin 3
MSAGGVVVFSAEGCDKCRQLKAALASHDVVYTDISLSRNPERIYDLVSLCGRNGVPQVFVEGQHIGGGDETVALLSSGGLEKFYAGNLALTPVQNTGPVDPRFALSTVRRAGV